MFKKLAIAAALGLLFGQVAVATAAEKTAQQEKMANCNKEAKEKQLNGDERKTFMKECLSAKTETKAEAKGAVKAETKPAKESAPQKK